MSAGCAYAMPAQELYSCLCLSLNGWSCLYVGDCVDTERGLQLGALVQGVAGAGHCREQCKMWLFRCLLQKQGCVLLWFLVFCSPGTIVQKHEWTALSELRFQPKTSQVLFKEQVCTSKAWFQGHCHHCTEFCAVYLKTVIFHTQRQYWC